MENYLNITAAIINSFSSAHGSFMVTAFLVAVTKYLTRSSLKEKLSIVVGKTWWQECTAAEHTASITTKNWDLLSSFFLFILLGFLAQFGGTTKLRLVPLSLSSLEVPP